MLGKSMKYTFPRDLTPIEIHINLYEIPSSGQEFPWNFYGMYLQVFNNFLFLIFYVKMTADVGFIIKSLIACWHFS